MTHMVWLKFGEGNNALYLDVLVEADTLEQAIEKGRNVNAWDLFRKGVTWVDGSFEIVGVHRK